jgi:transmembrane sensor
VNNTAPNNPDDEDGIKTAAAAWIVQRDEGFTEAQAAEFEQWKESDPKHAAAVAKVEKTWGLFEKMPLLRVDPELSQELAELERRASPRQKFINLFPRIGAVAAAACFALATGVWFLLPASKDFVETYATTGLGYQRVVLPDESVVELNEGTALQVQFSATERHVNLTAGEAHFTIAPDASRPFTVNVGTVSVRAVGTAFNVRLDRESVEVVVTEGKVQIGKAKGSRAASAAAASPDESQVFEAGQWVIVSVATGSSSAPVVVTENPAVLREKLSWQTSRLVFRETPLAEVVEQFNLQNQVQLSIGDAELAARPVGGNFRADQVEAFIQLLEDQREITVERTDPDHIVLKTRR